MAKAKLFHAGYGKWEVRQKRGDGIFGIGYFYPKKEAIQVRNKLNKKETLIELKYRWLITELHGYFTDLNLLNKLIYQSEQKANNEYSGK